MIYLTQVARALTLFNVDEVVVFEEGNVGDTAGIAGMKTDPSAFLARILQVYYSIDTLALTPLSIKTAHRTFASNCFPDTMTLSLLAY